MKITVFKYGEAMYKAANLFADLEGEGKVPLAFCFYLIETSTQKILVDVGCDGRERYGFYTYRAPVEMLADYGLQPENITDVVITHAHFDHVAELQNYRHARLHIQKNEYARGEEYIGAWENLNLFTDQAQVAEEVGTFMTGRSAKWPISLEKSIITPPPTPTITSKPPFLASSARIFASSSLQVPVCSSKR